MPPIGFENDHNFNERTKLLGPDTPSDSDSETDIESQQPKKNRFRISARIISDATIGLSDGLTVPFALTAGLSALGDTNLVIYGGLAELLAGAISMGLGGYLGAKSELASYEAQKEETRLMITKTPRKTRGLISQVFRPYKLPERTLWDVNQHLGSSPKLGEFLLKFHHCEQEPEASRALKSAATISVAYLLGGLIPLAPYCIPGITVNKALYISFAVMGVALFLFGYIKTCAVVGWGSKKKVKAGVVGGVQMLAVGGVAAISAMLLVKTIAPDQAASKALVLDL